MAVENLGVSFSIDTTNLKAGLLQANRLIKESQSAYRAAAAEIEAAGDKTNGYESAIKALNSTIDVQRKRVDALTAEYERLESEGLDPSSAEMIKLRTDINKANAEMQNSISKLNKTESAFEDYKNAAQDAADAVDDAGDAADDAADDFGAFDVALGNVVANGITALVNSAKNAVSSLLGLAEATAEYRTEVAKIETAASEAGASTDYIKDKWQDMASVLGDEGAVGEGLNNLLAAGFTTQEQMDEITAHLEGAALKWKDTLKFEGLADGLQETLATGAAAGSFAEVLERSGVVLDDFNAGLADCSTEAEKQNYVLDQLSKLGLSEMSAAYRSQNADLIEANKAQAEYTESQAELGERMQPVATSIKQGFTDILNAFLSMTNSVDMEAVSASISKGFGWLINTGIPAIKNGIGWIRDNLPTITALAAGLTTAIVAQTAATKLKTLADMAAAKGITLVEMAQKALNTAMKANMIGIIITAITALVAAFVYLWNNCESFRNFWINLWENVKSIVSTAIEWIKKFFNSIIEFVKNNWQALLLLIANPFVGAFKLLWDNCEAFRNFWIGLWEGIKNAAGVAIDWLRSSFAAIGQFFSDTWARFSDAGRNAWARIKEIFGNVAGFFREKFGQAWSAVKAIFSTGGAIFTGIVDGISAAFKNIVNAIIRGINKVVAVPFNAINTALGKLRNVSIAGVSPFTWLPTIDVPQIPELAKGGIVNSATHAIIGEAGKEAVLPLERNTEWMDMLAERIAANTSGVTVNQTNHYSQAHSRYELWQSRKDIAAAVRLARV